MKNMEHLELTVNEMKDSEVIDKYIETNMHKSIFEFAEQFSSNNHSDNLFKIYLDEKTLSKVGEEHYFSLMPNQKKLVATIKYDPNLIILPRTEFYGPYLKLEFYKKENDSNMEIYIHNTSLKTDNGYADYVSLDYNPIYQNVIGYLGETFLPVYQTENSRPIAIGIRTKNGFDLEKIYTYAYPSMGCPISELEKALQWYEDYKKWILNVKNENSEKGQVLKKVKSLNEEELTKV